MEVDTGLLKLSLSNELIKEALSQSIVAHTHNQSYLTETIKYGSSTSSSSSEVLIIAFKGSWEEKDWYHDDHFGETNVDQSLFPSLRRIGENRLAKVNRAILKRFQDLLNDTGFETDVENAVEVHKKKILVAGHSYGAALASFATLWILDKYKRKPIHKFPIGCVTFGAPLIGDETLSHAVRREKWSGHFTHFVMEHDIIPRIMLSPKTSIQKHLPKILESFQKKVNLVTHKHQKRGIFTKRKTPEQTLDNDPVVTPDEAVEFFENVVINASTVASHDAHDLMEPTSTIKEKLSADYVKVSPYRPFGDYVFCTCGETQSSVAPRQQLVVENPNAVLQLLFYFLQLSSENQDLAKFAGNSLDETLRYKDELKKNGLQLQSMVYLDKLNDKLWTSNGTTDDVVRTSNKALFELTPSAKWCLIAVEESEKRKKENMDLIKKSMRAYKTEEKDSKQKSVEYFLDEIRNYKDSHGNGNEDYYDAFKLQNKEDDFRANVNRLELAKIYDVTIEMVMRKDLPDDFEAWDELVKQATMFRRRVEPLDIANYYRHLKGNGYMDVRPKRYKFTQRWFEHANTREFKLVSESNFVAKVEELMKELETLKKTRDEVKVGVASIQDLIQKWKSDDKVENDDVFWGDAILSKLEEKLA